MIQRILLSFFLYFYLQNHIKKTARASIFVKNVIIVFAGEKFYETQIILYKCCKYFDCNVKSFSFSPMHISTLPRILK